MGTLKPAKNPKISASEALVIFKYIFGSSSLSEKDLDDKDRGYAQAMLVDMLNASFAMGFVDKLLKSAAKIPSGPKKFIISFLKGAGKNLVKYKDKDDLKKMMKEPVLYKSVVSTMARNFKSSWKIRQATGSW